MIIYAIDDEKNALEYITRKIKSAESDAEVYGFNSALEAIESAKKLPFIIVIIAIIQASDVNINEKFTLLSFEIFPFVAYIDALMIKDYTWIYPAN